MHLVERKSNNNNAVRQHLLLGKRHAKVTSRAPERAGGRTFERPAWHVGITAQLTKPIVKKAHCCDAVQWVSFVTIL